MAKSTKEPEKEQEKKPEDSSEETAKETLDEKELDENKIEEDSVKRRVLEKLTHWTPKSEMGKKVKSGEISDIDEISILGKPILEVEIIDTIFPGIESELLMIGQSKGKFGGGARRVFKQTQKKTKEGNKPSFATVAVVGNRNGYVGVGYGKAKETVPAREKALRRAKLNMFSIKRGSGSWLSSTNEPHSIPFAVSGKCGSTEITLYPAPVGKGLIIEKECRKILELAGIQDIWSKTKGKTGTKTNLIDACVKALKKLNSYKVSPKQMESHAMVTGNKKA